MDCELSHSKHRLREANEACLDALTLANEDATGEGQVAIEPRIEEDAAINLDAQLSVTFLLVFRVGLQAEVRAVGMGADDAEARDPFSLRDDEGEEARSAVSERVAAR